MPTLTTTRPLFRAAFQAPRQRIFLNSFQPLSTRLAKMSSTISAAITKDHRELEEYYNEVINNPNDHDHQERYGNQFTWELARHSVGEELVVYPAFEKFMGSKGHEMAESDRKEHHKVSLQFPPLPYHLISISC